MCLCCRCDVIKQDASGKGAACADELMRSKTVRALAACMILAATGQDSLAQALCNCRRSKPREPPDITCMACLTCLRESPPISLVSSGIGAGTPEVVLLLSANPALHRLPMRDSAYAAVQQCLMLG